MKKEKSCGAIIFKDNEVLLIKQTKGHWDFPKGHVEEFETEVQTALREVKEETNVDIIIDENYRYSMTYIMDNGIEKEVVFFVVKMIEGELIAQEEEVSDIKWIDYKEAFNVITYENTKELFRKVLSDLGKVWRY